MSKFSEEPSRNATDYAMIPYLIMKRVSGKVKGGGKL